MAKKYYWLKLDRNFFKRHDIKILKAQKPFGIDYTLFYIELLAESIDHNGELRYSKTKPYTPEMLGAVLGFDEDFAVKAFAALLDLELLEVKEDGTIVMTGFDRMTGFEPSEHDREMNRERQQRYRNNHSDD